MRAIGLVWISIAGGAALAQGPQGKETITQFGELARHELRQPALDTASAVALGDVDADGDLDVVVATLNGQNRLFRNDGHGRFEDVSDARLPADKDPTTSVALADVDRDGDLDAVFGNWRLPVKLYRNDGKGSFSDAGRSQLPAINQTELRPVTHVASGDVDGDGDVDLVLSIAHEASPWQLPDLRFAKLWLNDGRGTFQEASTQLPLASSAASCAALGDLDGDGDLDLVRGGDRGAADEVWTNDGRGFFRPGNPLPTDPGWTRGIALADVDKDGDLDLVLANFDASNRLLVNTGKASFVAAPGGAAIQRPRLPADASASLAVVAGDIDGDGDTDLIFGNSGRDTAYVNDGQGGFSVASHDKLPACADVTAALAIGDLDGDADLDLVAGQSGLHLLLNRQRQVHAPWAAVEGRRWAIDLWAAPGIVTGDQVAVPFVASRLAQPGIAVAPFGRFGLDPAHMVVLHAVTIPGSTGMAHLEVTLPFGVPKPASIYAQALFAPGARLDGWRFGNVIADPVRPTPVLD